MAAAPLPPLPGKAARTIGRWPASPYPVITLCLIQALRFVASGIVVGQIGYFFWWLNHDHYHWPWTFIILSVASSLTLLDVIVATAASQLGVTHPPLNTVANTCLSLLWILGTALLITNAAPTLSRACTAERWHNQTGIRICRIYKALFAFTVVGMAGSIVVLVLDAGAWHRAAKKRGFYVRMEDGKQGSPSSSIGIMDPSAEDPWAVPVAEGCDRSCRRSEEACEARVDYVPHPLELSLQGHRVGSGNSLEGKGAYTRL